MPKVTRRAALKALAATGVGAIAGTGAYGFLYARHQLTLTQLALPFRGLPYALDGLRLGLLTDVHRSRWVSHEDAAAAASLLMSERPDLIVLGGDYVTWGDRRYVMPSAEISGRLSASDGTMFRSLSK